MHIGFSHLIIENDCQFIVDKLLSEDFCSDLDNLLVDIKEWMGKFTDCKIHFAYRECNKVTHNLARHAWNIEHINLWHIVKPDFISNFL